MPFMQETGPGQFDLSHHDTSHEDSVLDEIIAHERKEMINDALTILPARESVALRLFYLEEQSMDEIKKLWAGHWQIQK
jgi:RNA polymerase sigma-70 factor (ECF subfamily)